MHEGVWGCVYVYVYVYVYVRGLGYVYMYVLRCSMRMSVYMIYYGGKMLCVCEWGNILRVVRDVGVRVGRIRYVYVPYRCGC